MINSYFQTLESNQRRKDIYHALTANMAVIFDFFLRLIELHVGQFKLFSETDASKANGHGRVVQVVLLTLTGFVEWVSVTHIMAQNGRLLQILCLLLNDSAFQYSAAECLSQVTFILYAVNLYKKFKSHFLDCKS